LQFFQNGYVDGDDKTCEWRFVEPSAEEEEDVPSAGAVKLAPAEIADVKEPVVPAKSIKHEEPTATPARITALTEEEVEDGTPALSPRESTSVMNMTQKNMV